MKKIDLKKSVITSCGPSIDLAKRVAKKLKVKFCPMEINSFPDGDIYLRYHKPIKGKNVIIIQSFQPEPNKTLFNIIFAAETARDLGAKKVILVSPYLAYIRQDMCFHPGECLSSKIMAKLLQSVDKIISIDPHLHRYKSLSEIFSIPTKKLTANNLIAEYIKKKHKNAIIVGPDIESAQWAAKIAKTVGAKTTILKKTRYSARKVKVKFTEDMSLKGKDIVIIDDIISTGGTIIEAAKICKKEGAKNIYVICIHGIYVENALEKIKKTGVKKVISTNTIKHKTNKIDITNLIVEGLK